MSNSVALHYDRLARLVIPRETNPMTKPIVPTLIDLPSELRGPRVLLRPYRADDAEELFAAIDESRDHLRPWLDWVDQYASIADTRVYCIRCEANWLLRTDLTLGIFHAESGQYFGGTGLHEPDWGLRSFEIGYWLRTTATRHGFVTEAVNLLRNFAFQELQAQRVHLSCDARNDASRRVAERCSFVFEGKLRNALAAPSGEPADRLVFALVPEDWERLRLD